MARKKKTITLHIESNPFKRNEMHFEVQKRTRVQVINPKKGKGSFKRNKRIKEDEQMKKLIKGVVFDIKKYHPYIVKFKRVSEDESQFNQSGDMGWFHLNSKEYQLYKANEKEIEVEIDD